MQKSHIRGQPQSTRQSRSRAAMSLRTAAQRRSRSRRESLGSSRTLRMMASLRRLQLQPLQAFEIIGDAAFEIVFGLVAELFLRTRNVVDAVHGVGRAEEVEPRP